MLSSSDRARLDREGPRITGRLRCQLPVALENAVPARPPARPPVRPFDKKLYWKLPEREHDHARNHHAGTAAAFGPVAGGIISC